MSTESNHSPMEIDEPPDIVPCFNGEEMNIDKDLVKACLTAISLKHMPEFDDTTEESDKSVPLLERNSFMDIHRPEMSKVPAAPKTPRKIRKYFNDQANKLGITNASELVSNGLNNEQPHESDQIRWLLEARDSFSSVADGMLSSSETEERIVNCAIPLTDEDLSPGEVPRKSRAQFCVLMRGFSNLSQETTDLMYEAADRLVEGSLDVKTFGPPTKKHAANEAAMSSPGSLYYNAEPTPDWQQGVDATVTAKSCITTQELKKGK